MHYTNEQYAMMERFEHGLNVTQLSEEEKFLFCFLQGENLLQPRADIEDGLFFLSEHGKRVLLERREHLAMLQKEADKDAKQEEHQAFQDKIAIANVLVPIGTFILGIVLEHAASIVDGVCFLWKLIFG